MKRLLIFILVLALITTACTVSTNPEPEPEPEIEENTSDNDAIIAPDFQLKSLDDSEIILSELRGNNVILNFWYTGCVFCVMEMPDLQKLQETYEEDLVLLTINVGEKKDKVEAFMEEENLSLNVLLDEDMKVANTYGVRSFPTTIAINKKGEVIGGYVGMLSYEQMEQLYTFFEE
ncbi:MAG TPA: TlpA family protein disulfide reductase [Tissierellia bacterium]|jgi:thiol-disulfide isomerase/thioredoxin|nr:TlpA family protein disulfide reductase [Tissierellia bacterium]